MAQNQIMQAVERIIDEGEGKTRSVLVRMRSVGDWREPTLRAAAYRMVQRNLALTARDILPEAVVDKTLAKHKQLEARRFKVQRQLKKASRGQIRSQAKRAVRGLLKAPSVSRYAESASKGALAQFISARSVLLELNQDDLVAMVQDTPDIGDIYPNRELRVPRMIEAQQLPRHITDNKTSAWGIHASGALAAWGAYDAHGRSVKVAVLDTGVDADHPDLKGKINHWAEFDALGQQIPNSTPHDTDRHGTHVAGTVVGGDASGQWIGVAPEANLAVGLVLDGAVGGTDAQVLAGIDWALLDARAHVINMSLGGLILGPDVPSTYTEAILTCVQSGVPVVTAIGNDGSQTSGSPGNDLLAFAVGATNAEDRAAGFSGGRTQIIRESDIIPPDFLPLPYSKPDISAPGVAVRSSIPGDDYAVFNGTSMATPHVAGAIALLLSATTIRNSIAAPDRAFFIQDLLTGAVEELGESGQDHRFGFGRLDILRAIGFAKDQGL